MEQKRMYVDVNVYVEDVMGRGKCGSEREGKKYIKDCKIVYVNEG